MENEYKKVATPRVTHVHNPAPSVPKNSPNRLKVYENNNIGKRVDVSNVEKNEIVFKGKSLGVHGGGVDALWGGKMKYNLGVWQNAE